MQCENSSSGVDDGTQKPAASPIKKVPASPLASEQEQATEKVKPTPLPLSQMVPMTFVLVNESLCQSMLLPFVGILVSRLQGRPVEEAGYYSGMMVGVFMLGQVVSGRLWGWLSDQYGRRLPLVSGLFTSGFMIIFFSLSTSVWMCAVFRALHGLCNGNTLVAKTMMADITDKTNQATGFAFVSFCFGIGLLIGPVIGGVLFDPAAKDSSVSWLGLSEDGVFGRHPALLPCLVIFVFNQFGVIACTFFVKETNRHAKPLPSWLRLLYPCLWYPAEIFEPPGTGGGSTDQVQQQQTSENDEDVVANLSVTFPVGSVLMGDPMQMHEDTRRFDSIIGEQIKQLIGAMHDEAAAESSDVMIVDHDDRDAALDKTGNGMTCVDAHVEVVAVSHSSGSREEHGEREIAGVDTHDEPLEKEMMDNNNPCDYTDLPGRLSTAASEEVDVQPPPPVIYRKFGYKQAFGLDITRFMLITYLIVSAADMAAGEIVPLWCIAPKSRGGLGFQSSDVGLLLFTNAVPCLVANMVFARACERYVNKVALFRLGVGIMGMAVFLIPLATYIPSAPLKVSFVLVAMFTRQFFSSWVYGLITMLTARSAPPGHVGSLMGVNQSCGSLARGLVPFFIDPLFAWSISGNHVFPFNHFLTFYVSAGTFWFCWGRSYIIRSDTAGTLAMDPTALMHRVKGWVATLKNKGSRTHSSVTIEIVDD